LAERDDSRWPAFCAITGQPILSSARIATEPADTLPETALRKGRLCMECSSMELPHDIDWNKLEYRFAAPNRASAHWRGIAVAKGDRG